MYTRRFDDKFGPDFLQSIPKLPGVYRIYDLFDALIYIGKAKDLRRRLSQYRNANRLKAHRKMLSIVKDAVRIEVEVLASESDALIQETLLIQAHRPKWNVASAYYFLYPMIGIRQNEESLYLCYTTEPDQFHKYQFKFYGAFRSRKLTREAFFAIHELLGFLLHPIPPKKVLSSLGMEKIDRYSRVLAFRQIDEEIVAGLQNFLRGEKIDSLDSLILALIENADARNKAQDIQALFNALKRFYRRESALLNRSCIRANYLVYPVPQKERDLIFVRSRFSEAGKKACELKAARRRKSAKIDL